MTAAALIASRWPALYYCGLIAVEEPGESPAITRNRELAAARSRKVREARKAAHLCVKCGAEPLQGRTLCAGCAEKAVLSAHKRREKIR